MVSGVHDAATVGSLGWRLRVRQGWPGGLRRRSLLWAIMLGSIVLVVLSRNDLEQLGATLLQGRPLWLTASVAAQLAYYFLYAAQYRYGFATVGVESRVTELIPVMLASIFVRTIVPSGGVSGAAVFVDDAARRGQSAVRAAEGSLLVLAADLATLLPILVFALAYLAHRGSLHVYETVAGAVFILFVAALAAGLFAGRLAPGLLRRGLWELQWLTNEAAHRLGRPPILPADWSAHNAADLAGAANDIATHLRSLGGTLGVATAAQLANLATVHTVARAYGQPLGAGPLLAAYAIEMVFSVVTFIPSGLIVAEGVMVAVLTSLGVPTGSALAITLAYRGLNVWLPLLVGFLFLRKVRSFGGEGC